MAERYEVPGWPAQVNGFSAATPVLTRLAGGGAFQYKDGVVGQPGTQRIPVEPNTPLPDEGDKALMGLSRSTDAPGNWFLPNLYYARPERDFWPGAGQPIQLATDDLMPVPATDPRGIPARMARPITIRGQRQVGWMPAVSSWPGGPGG